jgi:hypothetical protein
VDEIERLAADIVEDHPGANILIVPTAGGISYPEFLRLRELVGARNPAIVLTYATYGKSTSGDPCRD